MILLMPTWGMGSIAMREPAGGYSAAPTRDAVGGWSRWTGADDAPDGELTRRRLAPVRRNGQQTAQRACAGAAPDAPAIASAPRPDATAPRADRSRSGRAPRTGAGARRRGSAPGSR